MSAKLVAEEGNIKGLILSLEEFEEGAQAIIGRDPDACQLLIEDPVVSRRHLLCHFTPEGVALENLSTTNPVTINGEELVASQLLNHGDLVKIGGTVFRFYTEMSTRPLETTDEPPFLEKVLAPAVSPESEEEEPPEEEQEEAFVEESVKEEELPVEQELPAVEKPYEKEGPATEEEEPYIEEVLEDYLASSRSRRDTIFEEVSDEEEDLLAEIDFGLLESGRWLLKVISGSNNGAEFSMQSGNSYVIGTDPTSCDIIFHDTSVSRRHLRITVNEDETLTIEDLKSRNGTLIDGEKCEKRQQLIPNSVVTLGTTSFVVFDREGEMHTVIAPLLPSIVKVLQKEPEASAKTRENQDLAPMPAEPRQGAEAEPSPSARSKEPRTLTGFIILAIITGLFVIAGIGTVTLFHSEPVAVQENGDHADQLAHALAPFPQVQYTYNKATGTLFMVGHVLTESDKKQLIYNLQGLRFIKSIDDAGIVIDEYVWQEVNPLLAKNPKWRSISIQAPAPGNFTLTGYLKTRKDMEDLSEYISSNFPYLDMLDNKVVVEEDLAHSAEQTLQNLGITRVRVTVAGGEMTLQGSLAKEQEPAFKSQVEEFKAIPGIRRVQDNVTQIAPEKSLIDITNRYSVSGVSTKGGNVSVVIDGRIVSKGDLLDGMTITSVTAEEMLLEKDGIKYRIGLK